MPSLSSRQPRNPFEPTPAYLERRKGKVLPKGYIAVLSTVRHPLVHLVASDSFMDVAKIVKRHGAIRTLCDVEAKSEWTMIPRDPSSVTTVSCPKCRYHLSHDAA